MDPFENCTPLPGLEHLGRHILDRSGAPSGSPANFEALRGKVDESEAVAPLSPEEIDAAVRALIAEFGGSS